MATPQLTYPNMSASFEQITPDDARRWLARRSRAQRRVIQTKVRSFAEDMKSGRWHQHGQPIQFDREGNLIDGQNRLEAIVVAGVPIKMLVVRGVPTESFAYVDIGARRTAAQFIDGQGRADIAHAADWVMLYEATGGTFRNWQNLKQLITIDDTVGWVDKHPYVYDHLQRVGNVYKACGLHRGTHLALLTLVHEVDQGDIAEWLRGLQEGSDLAKGDPRLVLRERWLRDSRMLNLGGKTGGVLVRWAYLVKAWNAYMSGRHITMLRYDGGDELPVPMGI